jgi:hypothetical protein
MSDIEAELFEDRGWGEQQYLKRVRELEDALREAIGWSYGDSPTPERRDELEALL